MQEKLGRANFLSYIMYNMKNDMKQNKKEKYWDIYSVIGLLTFGWVLWLLVGLFPKKETKYPRIYNK